MKLSSSSLAGTSSRDTVPWTSLNNKKALFSSSVHFYSPVLTRKVQSDLSKLFRISLVLSVPSVELRDAPAVSDELSACAGDVSAVSEEGKAFVVFAVLREFLIKTSDDR